MEDITKRKIVNATMQLVMKQGYSAMTTKEIAKEAGINECTIFRKFGGKKDIVLYAMKLPEWNPRLSRKDFTYIGDLEQDLNKFSKVYMSKVTPEMVKISIGLRCPELYSDTAEGIMEVPQTFKMVLVDYFQEMYAKKIIRRNDYETMAMMFLSMNFGFVFLKASFENQLTPLEKEQYCKESVHIFVGGIAHANR